MLAVNLSPVQFRSRNLVQVVISALANSGLGLELEITESVFLAETEANLSILHQLRELGVSISLDDFGTDYSSLSYLRSFPFDKIKIDRSFVKDLAKRSDCGAIVRAISGLGRSLNITTIAEGWRPRSSSIGFVPRAATRCKDSCSAAPGQPPSGAALVSLWRKGVQGGMIAVPQEQLRHVEASQIKPDQATRSPVAVSAPRS